MGTEQEHYPDHNEWAERYRQEPAYRLGAYLMNLELAGQITTEQRNDVVAIALELAADARRDGAGR